jgi:glycosyltransferase involved in cell wall biosynthesis
VRIVHVNTGDINGGAARAIYRIHRGLLALGEDSSLLVRDKSSRDQTVVPFAADPGLAARLRRQLRRRAISRDARRYLENRPLGYELFSDDRTEFGAEVVHSLPDTDIVSLNWVARFVDFESFFRGLPPGVPVVWRLPDMFPYGGGCHNDAGCGRYAESCGNCPQLGSSEAQDLSRQSWLRKREAYEALHQLQIVAIGSSQAAHVRLSSLMGGFPVTVIPCAVDVHTFFPRPRPSARECLGLPPDRSIVLMVTHDFGRSSKGAELLSAALGLMHGRQRPFVLTVGHGDTPFTGEFEHLHWGPATDDRLLALLYSAADLLVFPSPNEGMGFGQVIVEALACGLPVVGFDDSGIRDAIRPGITGFVAHSKTADALADALQVALEDIERLHGMAQACRETVEQKFSVEVVARQYQALYRALLAKKED